MVIRAILLDFGGVLIKMTDDRPRLELAAKLGMPVSSIDKLIFYSESAQKASMGEISVRQHWETVRQGLGISPQDMPGFLQSYWSANDVNWELLEYVKGLRPNCKLGLLSNAWEDTRQTMHQLWNIDGLFDDMVISAEVKLAKPDPRIFHLALERLQVQASEAVFIDDTAINITAARREGLIAIQYQNNQQTLDELRHVLSSG